MYSCRSKARMQLPIGKQY